MEEPGVRGGARCWGRSQVLGEEERGRHVEETKLNIQINQSHPMWKQFSLLGEKIIRIIEQIVGQTVTTR